MCRWYCFSTPPNCEFQVKWKSKREHHDGSFSHFQGKTRIKINMKILRANQHIKYHLFALGWAQQTKFPVIKRRRRKKNEYCNLSVRRVKEKKKKAHWISYTANMHCICIQSKRYMRYEKSGMKGTKCLKLIEKTVIVNMR